MIGELLNFPHNKDNTGIMRFLFRRDDYWNLFRIYSSGAYSEEYKEENAFDFSTSDYWLGKMQSTPTYISFCFNNYSVKPIGYEITASTFAARPRRWAFSGSKDNSIWNFYEEKKRDLASNETFFVDWNPGTFLQCFKFDCLESVATEYVNRFDVQSIDIYGYLKTGDIITRFFSISQVNHFLILSLLVIIS